MKMEKTCKIIRIFLCGLLYAAGFFFGIAAFLGHMAAWPAAAVCFFAAVITTVWRGEKRI